MYGARVCSHTATIPELNFGPVRNVRTHLVGFTARALSCESVYCAFLFVPGPSLMLALHSSTFKRECPGW